MKLWFDHILHHMRAQPLRPAIVLLDRAVSYSLLALRMNAAARRLVALKLEPGAPVAIAVKSPLQQMVLALALFRIGIPSMSIYRLSELPEEIAFAAVLGDPDAANFAPAGSRFIALGEDWYAPDPTDNSPLPDGFTSASSVCRLSLTSGTTGVSKVFQDSIAEIGDRAYHNYFGGIDANRNGVLCMLGLSTSFGFGTACATLAAGRPLYFARSSGEALLMIELLSIDFMVASTEQVLSLVATARRTGAKVRSLRTLQMGGSAPSRTLLESAMSYLCKDILCQYGTTEIGVVARTMARDVLTRPGLAGFVRPGLEVGIFDAAGKPCPVGQAGAIKARRIAGSHEVQSGERTRPDWVALGDHGWLAADGQLFVAGRSSEQTASGPHASPEIEVEHILRLECDYDDAAAVVLEGEPGARRLAIGIGVVGNRSINVDQITSALRMRGLDVSIRLFDLQAIPRAINGKVKRDELMALIRAASPLGAASASLG